MTFCRRRTTKYISRLTYFTFLRIQEKTWKSNQNGYPKVIKKHPKWSPGLSRKSSKKSWDEKSEKGDREQAKNEKGELQNSLRNFWKAPKNVFAVKNLSFMPARGPEGVAFSRAVVLYLKNIIP